MVNLPSPPKHMRAIHHYTKKEWAAKLGKDKAKEEAKNRSDALVEMLDQEVEGDGALATADEDPFEGLNDRQKQIARLIIRGMSQRVIAKVLNISQPLVSVELKRIREHYASKGAVIDQNTVVGTSLSVFEEVEHKAWEIFHTSKDPDTGKDDVNAKTKALALVMSAREKQNKLLLDLGLLKRQATEHTHTVQVSPFMQQWQHKNKDEAAEILITTTLSTLEEPELPMLVSSDEDTVNQDDIDLEIDDNDL